MYICICNALTDKQIRSMLGEAAGSTAKVYACLGCRPQCGKCVPYVRNMVRQHCDCAAEAEAEVPLMAAE